MVVTEKTRTVERCALPRLWLVRLGSAGEFESLALTHGLISVDFGVTEDLSDCRTRGAIFAVVDRTLPNATRGRRGNVTGQLHRFANEIQLGDTVVSPLRTLPAFAIGEIAGTYEQVADGRAARSVRWLSTSARRSDFDQDLLYSLGALMTVCEIRREEGISRVRALAGDHLDQ
jgi:restriction system protein